MSRLACQGTPRILPAPPTSAELRPAFSEGSREPNFVRGQQALSPQSCLLGTPFVKDIFPDEFLLLWPLFSPHCPDICFSQNSGPVLSTKMLDGTVSLITKHGEPDSWSFVLQGGLEAAESMDGGCVYGKEK